MLKGDPKISFVVAAYNVESYILEALSSISPPCFDWPVEVIIVDDGSTDTTSSIVKDWSEEFPEESLVISQENAGLSAARNSGLTSARGEYIFFVDGDDKVNAEGLRAVVETADRTNADITVGGFERFWTSSGIETRAPVVLPESLIRLGVVTGSAHLLTAFQSSFRRLNVWNKLYRSSFIRAAGIRFEKGILYEDVPFTFRAVLSSTKTVVTKDLVYLYRQRPDSIMSAPPADAWRSRKKVAELLLEIFDEFEVEERLFYEYSVYQLWEAFKSSGNREKKLYAEIVSKRKLSPKICIRLLYMSFGPRLRIQT